MPSYVPFNGELETPSSPSYAPFTGELEKPRTPSEALLHQLGRIPRIAVDAATGTGQVLGDAVVGGVANPLLNALNKFTYREGQKRPPIQQLPLPSQAQSQAMTNMGIPQHEGPAEQVTGLLGSAMLGGKIDPLMNAFTGATARAINAPPRPELPSPPDTREQVDKMAYALRQKGYQLPPTVYHAGLGSRSLEGLAGKGNVVAGQSVNNMPLTNQLARENLTGWDPKQGLTFENLDANISKWADKGYRPIEKNLPIIGFRQAYRNELADILRKNAGDPSFPAAMKPEVVAEVNKYNIPYSTGKGVLNTVSQLRKDANMNIMSGDPTKVAVGRTQKDIAGAIENNVERSIRNNPRLAGTDLLQNWREARAEIAKSYTLKESLVGPESGVVDAGKMFGKAVADEPLTGGFNTIARAGDPMMGASTRPPYGGDPVPFNLGPNPGAGAGGAAAMASGSPVAAAAAGGMPVLRGAARALLNTNYWQNRMAQHVAPPIPSMFSQYADSDALRKTLPLYFAGMLGLGGPQ